MSESKFFAVISRMKYINRWALMRNTINENISEHSLEVAFIAHVLALIRNKRFGGNVSPERCALLAMYHDVTEIITGDLPTPIKYYSHEIKGAYDEIEQKAKNTLVSYLPDDLKEDFEPLFCKTSQEEDFASAEKSTLESIVAMNIPEANVFLDEFIPAYTLTLDEQA